MTTLLTLDIPVRLTGGFPRAEIDVRITPRHEGSLEPIESADWSYDEQPQISVALSDALAAAALPRAGREQIIPPWRWQVGAKTIPWYRMLPGSYVEETIEGVTTFGFSVPRYGSEADKFMEPLGSPTAWRGVPGGKGSVNVTAEFLTAAGRKSVALVRDGVLDNTSGDVGTRTFAGGGAHGRVDRVPVTYQAPPGHGQTSGTVVRRLLELAGVAPSKIAISGGRRLYKEITLVDANPIKSANLILEPEQRRVYHDERSDTWRLMDYGGVEGKRVEFTLRESDVLDALGTLGDGAAADAPTAITLTGSAQVTREECGTRLEYQVIDSYAVREIRASRWKQNSSGVLVSHVVTGSSAALRKVRRQVIVKEYDCETLVATETVTWEWFAPQAVRYVLNTSGEVASYNTDGFIFDSGATADDASPMYAWSRERWTVTAWSREEHTFDDRGYLTATISRTGAWAFADDYLKDRTLSSDPWDAEPFNVVGILADGRPVRSFGQGFGGSPANLHREEWYGPFRVYDETDFVLEFQGGTFFKSPKLTRVYPPIIYYQGSVTHYPAGFDPGDYPGERERQVTTFRVNDDGFVTGETAEVFRHFIRPARRGTYLYQETESFDEVPVFAVAERQETTYAAAGESNHDRLWSRYAHDGTQIEGETELGIPGYLPAAEQRQDIVPPESAFDDPAEYVFALAASRQESRAIKVRVTASGRESVAVAWEQKGRTVEYAETEDDLAAVGAYELRAGSAIGFDFPMPFNPLVRPGQRIVVDLPTLGWHYDVLVERVRHAQEDAAVWTQVSGRHDVV